MHFLELCAPIFNQIEWDKIRNLACKKLIHNQSNKAVELLNIIPFELYEGYNKWGDQFYVLHAYVNLEKYMEVEDAQTQNYIEMNAAGCQIASVIEDISSKFIRFVILEIDTDTDPNSIPSPKIQHSTEIVQRALLDAEQLIKTNGPISAVDRVHTALHGYLKNICKQFNLPYQEDNGITLLYKIIRTQHPAFSQNADQNNEIDIVLKSMSNILEKLNALRNNKTLAHPKTLLGEAEAMLAINISYTILHYLDSKIR